MVHEAPDTGVPIPVHTVSEVPVYLLNSYGKGVISRMSTTLFNINMQLYQGNIL